MKVDVLIPTLGEWALPFCVESVRRRIPVNRLILVGPSNDEKVRSLADIFVPSNEKNVGKARAKGLEYVKTDYYASVDSDLILSPHWYMWCVKTIQPKDVGACQGSAKTVGRISGRMEEDFNKRGGFHYLKTGPCFKESSKQAARARIDWEALVTMSMRKNVTN